MLAVSGEVDLYTAPQLKEAIDGALSAETPHLVFDLADLGFIDSTGLGVLVGALKGAEAMGGDVTLRNPSASTRKVLEIGGLAELFTIEEAPGATG